MSLAAYRRRLESTRRYRVRSPVIRRTVAIMYLIFKGISGDIKCDIGKKSRVRGLAFT